MKILFIEFMRLSLFVISTFFICGKHICLQHIKQIQVGEIYRKIKVIMIIKTDAHHQYK